MLSALSAHLRHWNFDRRLKHLPSIKTTHLYERTNWYFRHLHEIDCSNRTHAQYVRYWNAISQWYLHDDDERTSYLSDYSLQWMTKSFDMCLPEVVMDPLWYANESSFTKALTIMRALKESKFYRHLMEHLLAYPRSSISSAFFATSTMGEIMSLSFNSNFCLRCEAGVVKARLDASQYLQYAGWREEMNRIYPTYEPFHDFPPISGYRSSPTVNLQDALGHLAHDQILHPHLLVSTVYQALAPYYLYSSQEPLEIVIPENFQCTPVVEYMLLHMWPCLENKLPNIQLDKQVYFSCVDTSPGIDGFLNNAVRGYQQLRLIQTMDSVSALELNFSI